MNKTENLTIKETFALAVQNHQKNNLKVAENLYKKILKNTLFLACLGSQTRSKLEAKKIVSQQTQHHDP